MTDINRIVYSSAIVLLITGVLIFFGIGPLANLGCDPGPEIHVYQSTVEDGVSFDHLSDGQRSLLRNAIKDPGMSYQPNETEQSVIARDGLPYAVEYNGSTYKISRFNRECGVGITLNTVAGLALLCSSILIAVLWASRDVIKRVSLLIR